MNLCARASHHPLRVKEFDLNCPKILFAYWIALFSLIFFSLAPLSAPELILNGAGKSTTPSELEGLGEFWVWRKLYRYFCTFLIQLHLGLLAW